MPKRFLSIFSAIVFLTSWLAATALPSVRAVKMAKVSYCSDVASILNAHCVTCHRPNEVAPFSLIGYDNAKPWAHMISKVTQSRQMPPWKAVPGYGEFAKSNTLTKAEIETLRIWAEQGAARGMKSKEPPAPSLPTTEWSLGNPDLILNNSKPFVLGAEGGDLYRNFVCKLNNDQPLYVTAFEAKPGNRKIVHHVIAFLDSHGRGQNLESKTRDGQLGYTSGGGGVGFLPDGSLGGWAPGIRPAVMDPGQAFVVPPHTDVILQVHYHRSGKEESDNTRLALYYSKVPVTTPITLNWLYNFQLKITPGEKEYKARRTITYHEPFVLYAVMPHMHLLGRKMKSWLEFPDGTIKPLIEVDDWDFNWQLSYRLKQPIHVPVGTKQVLEAVYDNSSDNPRNPNNPPKFVTWGEATTDEMCLLIETVSREKRVTSVVENSGH